MYVLAEGWNCGELADEVEVGSSEGMDGAAVISGQSFIGRQSQILHRHTGVMRVPTREKHNLKGN